MLKVYGQHFVKFVNCDCSLVCRLPVFLRLLSSLIDLSSARIQFNKMLTETTLTLIQILEKTISPGM